MLNSAYRADNSLHDCIKSCFRRVQVSRGFLFADFLGEQCAVVGQAQDVFVAEGCCAVVWKTWILQILWRPQNERHHKLLQERTKTWEQDLADHLAVLKSYTGVNVRLCVLLTDPQVFSDVPHLLGKVSSEVLDVLKITSHRVTEVHQEVKIDGIILCPLELESKFLWLFCRVKKTEKEISVTATSHVSSNNLHRNVLLFFPEKQSLNLQYAISNLLLFR